MKIIKGIFKPTDFFTNLVNLKQDRVNKLLISRSIFTLFFFGFSGYHIATTINESKLFDFVYFSPIETSIVFTVWAMDIFLITGLFISFFSKLFSCKENTLKTTLIIFYSQLISWLVFVFIAVFALFIVYSLSIETVFSVILITLLFITKYFYLHSAIGSLFQLSHIKSLTIIVLSLVASSVFSSFILKGFIYLM